MIETKGSELVSPKSKTTDFFKESNSENNSDKNINNDSEKNKCLVIKKQSSKKKPKLKCKFCNKKVGLLGIKCKCGNLYCSLHLHAESHNCTYDFKSDGKELLKEKLIRIDADKIQKI